MRQARLVGVLVLLAAGAAVGQGRQGAITIAPLNRSLDVGESVTYVAKNEQGQVVKATFAVSDPLVVTLGANGLVTGRSAGQSVVQAKAKNLRAETTVFVTGTTQAPPPPPAPPQSSGVGPQATITCPAGAVDIFPGTSIQTVVNAQPATTTFCLRAGVHALTGAITPQSGNTFVGEYGAVLDGSGWVTTDLSQAAFRSNGANIDDVTIRNLVIRDMPARGIYASYIASERWTVEYTEITANRDGVHAPKQSLIRHNFIHHNVGDEASSTPALRGGGYAAYRGDGTIFEGNEIAYNGSEQKIVQADGVVFRNNFVHHNAKDGIWYDADNRNSLIDGNRVEDHPRDGIFYEISGNAIIRNNIVRRSNDAAIFVSTSRDGQYSGNTLEDNGKGIWYFVACVRVGAGTVSADLTNNTAYENTVRVPTTAGALANILTSTGCSGGLELPYTSGAKNNTFTANQYQVPSLTVRYWAWGLGQLKSWAEWQALGQDTSGSVQ